LFHVSVSVSGHLDVCIGCVSVEALGSTWIVHMLLFGLKASRVGRPEMEFDRLLCDSLGFAVAELQMVSRNAILASGLVAFATAGLLFPVVLR
jgi:hypothetical protein